MISTATKCNVEQGGRHVNPSVLGLTVIALAMIEQSAHHCMLLPRLVVWTRLTRIMSRHLEKLLSLK